MLVGVKTYCARNLRHDLLVVIFIKVILLDKFKNLRIIFKHPVKIDKTL